MRPEFGSLALRNQGDLVRHRLVKTQCWEVGVLRTPGALWPPRVAEVVNSRPVRSPVSKEVGVVPEDDT